MCEAPATAFLHGPCRPCPSAHSGPRPQQGGHRSVSRWTRRQQVIVLSRRMAQHVPYWKLRSTEVTESGEHSCPWRNVACGGPGAMSFTLGKVPEGHQVTKRCGVTARSPPGPQWSASDPQDRRTDAPSRQTEHLIPQPPRHLSLWQSSAVILGAQPPERPVLWSFCGAPA